MQLMLCFFFFQAEDGIRDDLVTGVQTCALPIYLEMIKPAYEHPIDKETYRQTIAFFGDVLRILHPFMPFITEELWHDEVFGKRGEKDCCIVAQLPKIEQINTQLLEDAEIIKQVVTDIRNTRNSKQISPK